MQDVWLRVLRSAGSPASGFRDEAGVKTWLYRITINRCRDIRKRESRRSRREMVSFRLHDTSKTANKESPSERARQDEADASGDALHSAVMALPAVQREAVLLCHHRGLTQTEAAAVLGIPEGTLKGRVRAGLAKLRRALASEQGDGGSGENGADQNAEAGLGDVGCHDQQRRFDGPGAGGIDGAVGGASAWKRIGWCGAWRYQRRRAGRVASGGPGVRIGLGRWRHRGRSGGDEAFFVLAAAGRADSPSHRGGGGNRGVGRGGHAAFAGESTESSDREFACGQRASDRG